MLRNPIGPVHGRINPAARFGAKEHQLPDLELVICHLRGISNLNGVLRFALLAENHGTHFVDNTDSFDRVFGAG